MLWSRRIFPPLPPHSLAPLSPPAPLLPIHTALNLVFEHKQRGQQREHHFSPPLSVAMLPSPKSSADGRRLLLLSSDDSCPRCTASPKTSTTTSFFSGLTAIALEEAVELALELREEEAKVTANIFARSQAVAMKHHVGVIYKHKSMYQYMDVSYCWYCSGAL